jgi:hypothetical protein
MGRSVRAFMGMLALLVAGADCRAAKVESTLDTLSVVSRSSGTGTNISKAEVETRELARDVVVDRVAKALEAIPGCSVRPDLSLEMGASTVRDFIGETSTHLTGVGLYVSSQPARERGMVAGFIAPYLAVNVKVAQAGKAAETIEVWDYERIPINATTNLDFVKDNRPALEKAVLSYVQKALEKELRKHTALLCAS